MENGGSEVTAKRAMLAMSMKWAGVGQLCHNPKPLTPKSVQSRDLSRAVFGRVGTWSVGRNYVLKSEVNEKKQLINIDMESLGFSPQKTSMRQSIL